MVWLSGVWEKLTIIPVSYITEESESILSISRIFHIGPQHPELISETPGRRRSSEEKCVPIHPKTWDSWGQGHTFWWEPQCPVYPSYFSLSPAPEGQSSREGGPEAVSLHVPIVLKVPFVLYGAIAGFQLHMVSITTEDNGMAKGSPARCDSVKRK